MSTVLRKKIEKRIRRKKRVRKKITGTAERPRMSVFRSNRHIYVQVIDDRSGRTVASASSLVPELRDVAKDKKKSEVARAVGKLVAERCLAAKVDTVVFDRNGYLFAGRVATVANAAREGGLKF